jgi:hypothetical protein
MSPVLPVILFIVLISCAKEDVDSSSSLHTVSTARALCGKSAAQMQWLADVIRESETDITLKGDIYALSVDGKIMFVHQPMISSCLACVLYDCEGNRLPSSTVDHAQIVEGMRQSTKIYSAI